MQTLRDFNGHMIRLTDERLSHILEHPEMEGEEWRIEETLLLPDSVVLSRLDPSVHPYHRLFQETPVTRKYLVVAVKSLEQDAFVITSFFSDKEKKGTTIWPR